MIVDEYRIKLTFIHRLLIKFYRWKFQSRVGLPGELTQEEVDDMDDWDVWHMRDVFELKDYLSLK